MPKPTAPHLFNNAAGLSLAYKLDAIWTLWEGSGTAYVQNWASPLTASLVPEASAGWSTDADGPVIRTNDTTNGWFSVTTDAGVLYSKYLVNVIYPDIVGAVSAYTIAMHLTVRSTSHNNSGIFYWGQSPYKNKGFFIADHSARTITFQWDTGTTQAYVTTTSAAYTVGTKFWLIGVYDGTLTASDRLKIYINGVQASVSLAGTPPASVIYNPDPGFRVLYVGSKTGLSADAADLDVSLIYTWARALSTGDITSLLASPYQFLSSALTGTVSTAEYDLYWGCDPQRQTLTPEDDRVPSHPNADSAKAAFLALITSPDVGTFENFVDDAGISFPIPTNSGTITLGATSGASVILTSTAGEFLATSSGVFPGSVIKEASGSGLASVITRDSTTQLTVRILTTFSSLTFTPTQLQIHRVGFYGANGAVMYISGGSTSFVNYIPIGTNGRGRYPVNGDYYAEFLTSGPTIKFHPGPSALGAYFIDPADFAGTDGSSVTQFTRVNYALTFSDATTLTIGLPGFMTYGGAMPAAGAVAYYGVILKNGKTISTANLLMSLADGTTNDGSNDIIGFDDVTWAITSQIPSLPTPEPPVTYLTPTSTLLAIPEVCAEDETGTLTLCRRCHYLYVRGKWMAHVCTPRWTSRTFIRGW